MNASASTDIALSRLHSVLARLELLGAPLLVHPGPGADEPQALGETSLGDPLWWPALTRYVADMQAAWLAFTSRKYELSTAMDQARSMQTRDYIDNPEMLASLACELRNRPRQLRIKSQQQTEDSFLRPLLAIATPSISSSTSWSVATRG